MALSRPALSRSAAWATVEAFGGSFFSSVGLLVVASLIEPSDLGLSAIALGIMQAVNFFPDALFHDAIIQRRRLTTCHAGSAFWTVMALAVLLGGIVAGCAGMIGGLYDMPALPALLQALSITSVVSALVSVQAARLRRAMRFRALAICTVVSRAGATIAGVGLALGGCGAWAMIAQYGLGPVILAVMLLGATRWGFVRRFSVRHVMEISRFAIARTAVLFVDVSRGRLFFVFLGTYVPLGVLGHVNLAFRLVDSLTIVICSALARFLLPVFSRAQNDRREIERSLLNAICLVGLLLLPLYAVLALTADDFIRVLASERWLGMEGLIPWLVLGGIAAILQIPAMTAILALGRPVAIAVTACGVLSALLIELLVIAPATGVQAVVCWTLPLVGGLPASLFVARWIVGVSLYRQLLSLVPACLAAALVCGAVMAVRHMYASGGGSAAVLRETCAAAVVYLALIGSLAIAFRFHPHLALQRPVPAAAYAKEVR